MKKDASVEAQLKDSEVRLLAALRNLSQLGGAVALEKSADEVAKIEEALAQLWQAQQQFEHLTRLVDAMPVATERRH